LTILEGDALRFGYEPTRMVIENASIQIENGSLTALIGANGCGKSTLIRLLGGVLHPSGGTVRYRGVPLPQQDRRKLARKLAYVPQNASGAFPFTALEVVLTGRTPHTPPFRLENVQDTRLAMAALEKTGIPHLAQRRITELSGGERQLVSVARALAQEPECLLLDEPAASLDLKHRAGLIRLLLDLRDRIGLTTVMITHDLSLLDPGFDFIYALHNGTIAAQGTPDAVLNDAMLAAVYDDAHIRARRVEGRLCVWSEVEN
jgi:iron complex transport system ATP-binding protein